MNATSTTVTSLIGSLHAPILASLLHLAWPILVVLAVQTSVSVAETYFVSRLGSVALAVGDVRAPCIYQIFDDLT
jgi:Na+-driven multidrug efflux pump